MRDTRDYSTGYLPDPVSARVTKYGLRLRITRREVYRSSLSVHTWMKSKWRVQSLRLLVDAVRNNKIYIGPHPSR